MSEKEINNKETNNKETNSTQEQEVQTEKKVVTKYDLKVQRREQEKAKEKRDKQIGNVVGVLVVVALVCLVASFPIRTYLAIHETYVKVAGENISRVEFDYNYNVVSSNYISQYGSYMSMFGYDLSGDLESMMYSDTLTFADYFAEMAVDNIVDNKALLAEADAAGFTYDTTADYQDFKDRVKEAASQAGVSQKEFIRENYGTYATMSRIEDFVKEALYLSAYYDSVADTKAASDEDAQNYYNENKADFDSVDYKLLTINAEVPDEATEEQTTAAMAAAKEQADAALATIDAQGELTEGMEKSSVPSVLRDWLFDDSRKAGDSTVVENTSSNLYYVVEFEQRYLDNTPTVTVRAALTTEQNGQALLEKWTAGDATEESFAALCDEYNDTSVVSAAGGLFENIQKGSMPEELEAWLYDDARAAGDTTIITPADDEYTYVFYFVEQGDPWWMVNIKNSLLNSAMSDYMDEISASITVEDPKGNLKYLQVSEEDTEGTDSTESAAADTSAESTEITEGTESAAESTEQAASSSSAQ